jgi:thiamine biosynthesis protein ThiS
MLNLVINGAERAVAGPITVEGLLKALDLGAARVAVEVNGRVVPRADHGRTTLRDGDRLEIVQFVGGG